MLFARPWYGGEETDLETDYDGLSVVVQIPIFNPNGYVAPPRDVQSDTRNSTENFSDRVINITRCFLSKKAPQTTYNESELYVLAKNTLDITSDILENDLFLATVVDEMKDVDGTSRKVANSTFRSLYE